LLAWAIVLVFLGGFVGLVRLLLRLLLLMMVLGVLVVDADPLRELLLF